MIPRTPPFLSIFTFFHFSVDVTHTVFPLYTTTLTHPPLSFFVLCAPEAKAVCALARGSLTAFPRLTATPTHLPELGTDLVAALAALNVNDLPHLSFVVLLLLPAFSFTFKNNAIIDT